MIGDPERQTLDEPAPRHALTCPVEDWLTFLGHRWTALVLWHLLDGEKRQSELMALLLGITAKVLSERLDGLRQRGLVRRVELEGWPRSVAYTITARGRDLTRILDQIEVWSRG